MKSPFQIVFLLVAIHCRFLLETHAQSYPSIEDEEVFDIDTLTSSSFELAFYPTSTKLDNEATSNVKNAINDALLMSSSGSSDFDSLQSIEILAKGVKFKPDYELKENPSTSAGENHVSFVKASFLQFKIMLRFEICETKAPRPSQFAVDNLIVRTFSQPSTKSYFIELVSLTGDPFLRDVKDIGINLVDDQSNENVENQDRDQLSSVDKILVIASSFILVGVFLVLMVHCKKDGYEDIQEQKSFQSKNRPSEMVGNNNQHEIDPSDPNDIKDVENSLARMVSVEGNIVEAGSLESSVDDAYIMRKKFGSAFSSSVSAPAILEESVRQSKNECKIDEKSIQSARSADSLESFELNENWNVNCPNSSKSITNQVLLNGLVMLESTQEFHRNWLESKRKALEDIEEESVEDVFHVDVQRSGIFIEEAETMKGSWSNSVSEWMKSIRVINSASETQSSVENSSIEPKSTHGRESNSLDMSLEDSLAASTVEP
eukprot:jgi/Psemu1/325824/estExt_fgenesh1_pg.C_2870023